jgi:hypothetical protein
MQVDDVIGMVVRRDDRVQAGRRRRHQQSEQSRQGAVAEVEPGADVRQGLGERTNGSIGTVGATPSFETLELDHEAGPQDARPSEGDRTGAFARSTVAARSPGQL